MVRIRKRVRNEVSGVKMPVVEEIPAPVPEPIPVSVAR
jgi:hypothetical protein